MKFLARLEANRLAWSDRHFRTSPRIAANPRLARADIEYAKAPQLNPVARSESFFQTFKNRIDRRFCFVARQSRLRDDLVDNVLFNQCLYPEGWIGNCNARLRPHPIACFLQGPAASLGRTASR